jgi:hypothetical protein
VFIAGIAKEKFQASIWLLVIFYILLVFTTTSLLVLMAIHKGYSEFSGKRKVFEQENWSEFLSALEFETAYTHQKDKQLFTQEAKLGHIKGFLTVADISEDKKKYVQFRFYVGNESINRNAYRALSKQLSTYNGGLEYGYLYKYIKATNILSARQIEQELNEFVEFLEKKGLRQSV